MAFHSNAGTPALIVIMAYDIPSRLGLVIDDKRVCSGRIPTKSGFQG